MKIMIIEPLGDGGIAHYSYNLLNALSCQGVEAFLFTAKDYELINEKKEFSVYNRMFRVFSFINKAIPYLSNEHLVIPSLLRKMIKTFEYPFNAIEALVLCKRNMVSVVHLQSINIVELIMVIMFKLVGTKVVFTVHNVMPGHGKLKNYHRKLYRIMYKLCNKVIVHTLKGKEELTSIFHVTPDNIIVIPHGDYKFFVPEKIISKREAKKSLGLSPGTKTVLFFGAIRHNKGLDFMLNTLPYLIEKVPTVKLMIVGELTEDYAKYRQIINKGNLQSHIFEELRYISNEEVSCFFLASDIVVLPYYEITQSGVLQIAYAFAKPVVATKLPGFEESIIEGKNGYLIPINNCNELSDRIAEILMNEDKIYSMGMYSRFLADKKFSWSAIAKKTTSLYFSFFSQLVCKN